MALRVRRLQRGGDRLPHRLVNDQPLGGALHHRQRLQAVVRVLRGDLRQQLRQQRAGDAAREGGGLQDPPGQRILDPLEVDAGEGGQNLLTADLIELPPRVLPDGGGGQLQRQRMAARDVGGAIDVICGEAGVVQQLGCRRVGERTEGDGAEQILPSRGGEPRLDRRVPPDQ